MAAYVVRHVEAGDRAAWKGDDRLRPLTKSGWRQADALAESLGNELIETILASTYLRCIQTVEPLARTRRLPVEPLRELEEGAGGESVMRLISRHRGKGVVLCTHGDVLEEFLERLIAAGLVSRAGARLDKGSTWVLQESDGRITGASYRPPPP
jgi:broad specificity phosphatase PhoE